MRFDLFMYKLCMSEIHYLYSESWDCVLNSTSRTNKDSESTLGWSCWSTRQGFGTGTRSYESVFSYQTDRVQKPILVKKQPDIFIDHILLQSTWFISNSMTGLKLKFIALDLTVWKLPSSNFFWVYFVQSLNVFTDSLLYKNHELSVGAFIYNSFRSTHNVCAARLSLKITHSHWPTDINILIIAGLLFTNIQYLVSVFRR